MTLVHISCRKPYLGRHLGEPHCANLVWNDLERGMPIEQIQKFLGHTKLETTQIYAESSAEMIKESYQRALAG
jgi:site-specific recombinase XerD